MIIQYLVRCIATQIIEYGTRMDNIDREFVGPINEGDTAPTIVPECQPGYELIEWAGSLSIFNLQPTPTSVLRWNQTGPAWNEEGELQALVAAAITQSYLDIDSVTTAAVGARLNEYNQAAADARAFAAAGYTGPTTSYVTSYALDNETNVEQTNEWSAKSIIARADAFDWAQNEMRAKRFNFQRAMRNSVTPADLAQTVYLWDQFILGLRTQLGL